MSSALKENAYGKSCVRLSKIIRRGDRHELKELTVDIKLTGQFEATYLSGDNQAVVATDSMKNTVYVLAAGHPLTDIESFASHIAEHFLSTYKHISSARVDIAESAWRRISVSGQPHNHAFVSGGGQLRKTSVEASGNKVFMTSAVDGLRVVKTTASEFTGFVRDKFTTLPEVSDRIFGTTISASWNYNKPCDYNACYDTVTNSLLETFACHYSLSVQQTLYAMGDCVLKQIAEIESIAIAMPNEHRIPFDLKPFGLENRNEIFVTTSEPYGLISATVTRAPS